MAHVLFVDCGPGPFVWLHWTHGTAIRLVNLFHQSWLYWAGLCMPGDPAPDLVIDCAVPAASGPRRGVYE